MTTPTHLHVIGDEFDDEVHEFDDEVHEFAVIQLGLHLVQSVLDGPQTHQQLLRVQQGKGLLLQHQ